MRKTGLLVFISWDTQYDVCVGFIKRYFRASELGVLECFRATNEMRKIASSKLRALVGFAIGQVKAIESRGIDQFDEVLQVRIVGFDLKLGESREDCMGRRTQSLEFLRIVRFTYRNEERECNGKFSELGQPGQSPGDLLWRHVTNIRDLERNEVRSRRKKRW